VAVIVALIFYAASQIRQRPKLLITSFATVGFLSVGVLTQMAGPKARLAALIDGYSAHRIDVWLNSWTLFKQQPILGYGLDTRQALLENHFIYSEHNIVLNVMLGNGTCRPSGLRCFDVFYLLAGPEEPKHYRSVAHGFFDGRGHVRL
jgi:O-antigen ligase